MKSRIAKNGVIAIPAARWLAYATASAASALAGASPAEAEIHYSGTVNTQFPPNESKSAQFPLDQAGDSLTFVRTNNGGWVDFFGVRCPMSGAFVGGYGRGFEYAYVFRIKGRHQDQYISRDPLSSAGFGNLGAFGTMIRSGQSSQNWRWHGKGTDFVGFRFNNGSGNQYGWVRVRMDGAASNFSFTVIDYAWADPGEAIKPGQTSSSGKSPGEGSLGLLATGAAGLALWRRRRARRLA